MTKTDVHFAQTAALCSHLSRQIVPEDATLQTVATCFLEVPLDQSFSNFIIVNFNI